MSYNGPKFIQDASDNPMYYHGYVEWLEKRVAELEKQCLRANKILTQQMYSQRRVATQRYWQEQDFVPYPEEDND